jgi:hypothetical protein
MTAADPRNEKRRTRPRFAHEKARGTADREEWVVWNGSMGILAMAAIGRIEDGEGGRRAFLAPPYDIVGPFSLDELETRGRIAFGECLVMSRRRWRDDQVELRIEARERRRAFLIQPDFDHDKGPREVLGLPMQGALEPSQIKRAFRRLAKTAHPDAGGSDEHYRRIAEARDALLGQFGRMS